MDTEQRESKIELYGKGYVLLMETLKDIPRQMWKFKPASEEWSVHEVLVHLADSETNGALRARKLIVEPGGTLMGYDQDKWTRELDYHYLNYEDALEIIRLVRKTTYQLLKKQPTEVFDHWVRHPEYEEPYTFEDWINIYSAHIPGHIDQIRNNYRIWRDEQG